MFNNYFIYLALGMKKYKNEAIYSIISLYRACEKKYRLVVYTDDGQYISNGLKNECDLLNYIDIIEIDHDKFQEWTRGGRFMIGAKVSAIKEFCDHYEGNLIFLDTDTVVFADITKYFEHINDGFILNFKRKKATESLKQVSDYARPAYKTTKKLLEGIKCGDGELKIGNEWAPYNSGIIGMRADRELIGKVAQYTEVIFGIAEYSTSEELAFSCVFQEAGKVIELKDEVIHYFVKKETRLIAGYCLNSLLSDDRKLLKEKLKEAKVSNLDRYKIQLYQCEYFLNYLDYFKMRKESYLWDTPHAQFYSATEDLRKQKELNMKMYKHWCACELK